MNEETKEVKDAEVEPDETEQVNRCYRHVNGITKFQKLYKIKIIKKYERCYTIEGYIYPKFFPFVLFGRWIPWDGHAFRIHDRMYYVKTEKEAIEEVVKITNFRNSKQEVVQEYTCH